MKLQNVVLPLAIFLCVSSAPLRKQDVPENLVPEFGHPAGLNPTGQSGTGDCYGIPPPNGQPIKTLCTSPPSRDSFLTSLDADVDAIDSPSVSQEDRLQRINAALVTPQNLNGPSVGCPAASTTFVAQRIAIEDKTAAAPSAPDLGFPFNPTPVRHPIAHDLAVNIGYQLGTKNHIGVVNHWSYPVPVKVTSATYSSGSEGFLYVHPEQTFLWERYGIEALFISADSTGQLLTYKGHDGFNLVISTA